MPFHILSLLHAVTAAFALVYAVHLLQLDPSYTSNYSVDNLAIQSDSAPQFIEKPSPARFITGLNAYDFNTGSQQVQVNTTSFTSRASLNNAQTFELPKSTPLTLTSIDYAVVAFCYSVQWLAKYVKAKKYAGLNMVAVQCSEMSASLLLLAPLMTLCSAAQFAFWSPSVQRFADSAATLSLYLLLQSICLVGITFLTPLLFQMFLYPASSYSMISVTALVSGVGLNAFSLMSGFDNSLVNPLLLVLYACLSPIGYWIDQTAMTANKTDPGVKALQALFAALFALFVSLMTENVTGANYDMGRLVIFAGLSFLSNGSQIILPVTAPILPLKLLRNQLSLVLALLLGFTDSSSSTVRIVYLTLVSVVILLPHLGWISSSVGEKGVHYIMLPGDTDLNNHCAGAIPSKSTYILFSIFSLLAMGGGFYQVAHPFLLYQVAPVKVSATNAALKYENVFNRSTAVPFSSADLYNPYEIKFGSEHRHQQRKIPDGKVPDSVISVLLKIDPYHPPVKVAQKKKARPFSVKAEKSSHPNERTAVFEVLLPPIESIPKRKWDPVKNPKIADHARDLTFEHLRIGVGGNPKYFTRSAFSANTWAQDPRVHWQTFWVGEDEPNGMVGEKSFIMEAFKLVVGHYPIITKGMPEAWFSIHIRWFKIIPFMYQQAPESTRWFLCGDDDSTFYLDTLFYYLKTIPEDPLKTSLYIGNIGEQILFNDVYGRESAYGGAGVLLSRHLAKRIHDNWQLCIDEYPEDFLGDTMMRDCVPFVTKNDGLGEVKVRKVPMFNQIDMFDHRDTGREYLSALFSRVTPITIHHHHLLPNMMVGMGDKELALFDFWHLTYKIPMELRYRRFFINFKDGRTAVITHGLHVRLYSKPLDSLDHNVDYDSNISHDPQYVGVPWLLDMPPEEYDPGVEHVKRTDYVDYWIKLFWNNTLIFANDWFTDEFHLGCKNGGHSVPSLCSESL